MSNPTCPQCDCVAGCRAKPELCPNFEQPVQTNPDALDATRYRWLRSVGGRTWTHLEKQAPAVGDNYDNLVDDAMIQQESAK